MRAKPLLTVLGLVTLVGFSLLGFLIAWYFSDQLPQHLFQGGWNWFLQIAIGLGYGLLSGVIAWQLIKSPLMKSVKFYYSQLIGNLDLSRTNILFISFSAGVGEEILFRGALQPLMGLWITSILFVAIHGYLNPFNWPLFIYGILMTAIILGIGWMFDEIGIISAMAAHFAIDVFLLEKMTQQPRQQSLPDVDQAHDPENPV